jgi:chorismate synthase
VENNIVRCPDEETATAMIAEIDAVRVKGDSCGGVVTCVVRNCPKGLGAPVFHKLEADLAAALMSIPATKVCCLACIPLHTHTPKGAGGGPGCCAHVHPCHQGVCPLPLRARWEHLTKGFVGQGFTIGTGFEGVGMLGSTHNDEFYTEDDGNIRTRTNRSGGIQGGISNGEHIEMAVAFKPTSTISRKQNTGEPLETPLKMGEWRVRRGSEPAMERLRIVT